MNFRKNFIVKNTVPFLFKSAKPIILLYFFFGCFRPIFSKSNGTEVIAWRLNLKASAFAGKAGLSDCICK
jgi:hypothetical protein